MVLKQEVNVNPDWNSTDPNSKSTILNKPDLGAVQVAVHRVKYLINQIL
jgi:hypothetical protein